MKSSIQAPNDGLESDLDDFILDNLLDDEISEFKKLMRLKQILETLPQKTGYII